jgi:dTDP-4-dehydrorhamnose 3,5-epimerase-like enzyme
MNLGIVLPSTEDASAIAPQVVAGPRSFFMETFRTSAAKAANLPFEFAKDNYSDSMSGILTGLHFRWSQPRAS